MKKKLEIISEILTRDLMIIPKRSSASSFPVNSLILPSSRESFHLFTFPSLFFCLSGQFETKLLLSCFSKDQNMSLTHFIVYHVNRKSISEFLNSGRKCWTLDADRLTLDSGRWTLDSGRWKLGCERWALESRC